MYFDAYHNAFLTRLSASVMAVFLLIPTMVASNSTTVKRDIHNIAALLSKQQTLKGTFKQTRKLIDMPQPLVSTGEFIYWKNNGLYWQTSQPFFSAITFSPKKILHWQERSVLANASAGNQRVEKEVSQILLSIFNGNIQKIEARFYITLNNTSAEKVHFSGAKSYWLLTLEPRNRLVKKIIHTLQIIGDKTIDEIHIASANGDTSTINFVNTQANLPLSEEECNFFTESISNITSPD